MLRNFILVFLAVTSLFSSALKPNASDLGVDEKSEYRVQKRSSIVFVNSKDKYASWFKILDFKFENIGKEQTQTFTIPFQYYKASQTYSISLYYKNYNNEKTLSSARSFTAGSSVASGSKTSFSYTIDSRDYCDGVVDFWISMTCKKSSTLVCSQDIEFSLSKYQDLYHIAEKSKQICYRFEYVGKGSYGYCYSYVIELSLLTIADSTNIVMEYDSIDPVFLILSCPISTSSVNPYLIIDNYKGYFDEFVYEKDNTKAIFPLYLECIDSTTRYFSLALFDEEKGGTSSFYYDRNTKKMTKTPNSTTSKIGAITLPVDERGKLNVMNCSLLIPELSSQKVTYVWDFTITFEVAEDAKTYDIKEDIGKISDNDFFGD